MTPEILGRNPKIAGLSVIIPSKTPANLLKCYDAVLQHQPDARVIVVDDGLDWSTWPRVCRIETIAGSKPFIFARNVNIGIAAAGTDDVVILNDDALLEIPNGFRDMQRDAEATPRIGLVSATTNVAGNPAQHRRPLIPGAPSMRLAGICPGNSFPSVAFVCVLIPRRTIVALRMRESTIHDNDRVIGPGPLDERFTAYGWEDNDLCRRLHLIGLRIGIHDGCYVDHGSLQSTFRGGAYAAGDIHAGRRIYIAKWGSM